MKAEVAKARLGQADVARLATVSVQGRPHIVPCCFVVAGDVVYSAVDAKPKSGRPLRRLENLEARGAFALLVDHYDDNWSELWWVRVDGRGRIVHDEVELGQAQQLLIDKYPQYQDVRITGPVIALEIESWTAWP